MDLRTYREKHGLSASEMGRRLGVAHSTVIRLESGELLPAATLLVRIANVTEREVMPNDMLFPAGQTETAPADRAQGAA